MWYVCSGDGYVTAWFRDLHSAEWFADLLESEGLEPTVALFAW